MQKLLFVCNDYVGSTMAGPGIRYFEMAQALERRGHQTALLTRYLEEGFSRGSIAFTGKASFVNLFTWTRRSDCVILPGSPLALILAVLLRKKMIIDQYDPVIFEFLERRPMTLSGRLHKTFMLLLWKVRQRIILRFGQEFLVANEKQKDFLIGQLTILGYKHKLDSVIVLPFGLPDEKPAKKKTVLRGTKIKETDFLLVWGGGIWDWFDPFSLLHALVNIRQNRDDIKVYFPGLTPPNPDSRKLAVVDIFISEARRLGLLDSTVIVNKEWTPYEDRGDYLLEADAAISLHRDNMETRFAFRTRMLDYVWAGLPIISSEGDSWEQLIVSHGLGMTVACGDEDGLVQAILKMADDPEFRKNCRRKVETIALQFTWDNIAARLIC
jgi:glycosyltransferase involved in cell wall biosynthesis